MSQLADNGSKTTDYEKHGGLFQHSYTLYNEKREKKYDTNNTSETYTINSSNTISTLQV